MSYYKPGCWNAICDVCGFTYKSDQLRKRWDGLMVCSKDYEMRHPMDFLKVPTDDPSVPWTRPTPASYTFVETPTGILSEDNVPLYTEGSELIVLTET